MRQGLYHESQADGFSETEHGNKEHEVVTGSKYVEPEPMPITNNEPFMWEIVIADMRARDEFGAKKYNTRLQPNTNRDPLTDAYQELLDAAVYIRTAIYERDGK
jgi:galactokinase